MLHRTVKEGLGAAYLHGFEVALERGYDVIGEMDADGSHQPEQLQSLLDALRRRRPRDRLALGAGRQHRELAAAPRAALPRRQLLHPPRCSASGVRDATAGYRLFRRTTLERIDLDQVESAGYVFQADLAFRTLQAGLRVVEVPIEFVERERGESKMSRRRGHRVAQAHHPLGAAASGRPSSTVACAGSGDGPGQQSAEQPPSAGR